MENKHIIAKRLRDYATKSNFKDEYKQLSLKCYKAYYKQCILKGKETFEVTFEGKYAQSKTQRIKDWFKYIVMSIQRFYLKYILKERAKKTLGNYNLINSKVLKPIHLKLSNTPDEMVLNYILNDCGLIITDEIFNSTDITYCIAVA